MPTTNNVSARARMLNHYAVVLNMYYKIFLNTNGSTNKLKALIGEIKRHPVGASVDLLNKDSTAEDAEVVFTITHATTFKELRRALKNNQDLPFGEADYDDDDQVYVRFHESGGEEDTDEEDTDEEEDGYVNYTHGGSQQMRDVLCFLDFKKKQEAARAKEDLQFSVRMHENHLRHMRESRRDQDDRIKWLFSGAFRATYG